MSATYLDTHKAPYARLAWWFSGTNYPLLVNDAYDSRDVCGQVLARTYFDCGNVLIEPGRRVFFSRGDPTRVQVLGSKPNSKPYDGSLDWSRYGSFVDSILTAGRVLSGSKPPELDIGREHNVTHANLSGDLGPSFSPTYLLYYDSPVDVHGVSVALGRYSATIPCPHFHGYYGVSPFYYSNWFGENDLSGWNYTPVKSLQSGAPFADTITVFRYWMDSVVTVHSSGTSPVAGHWSITVTNFQMVTDSAGVVSLSYETTWSTDAAGASGSCVFRTVLTLDPTVSFLSPASPFYEDGTTRALYYGPMAGSVEQTMLSSTPGILTAWFSGSTGRTRSLYDPGHLYSLSNQYFEDAQSTSGPRLGQFVSDRIWDVHYRAVNSYASDIRCSAFLSTADALDVGTASLGQDLWQTIVKLPQLADQIPDFLHAVRTLDNLLHGRSTVKSVKDMVDLATELRLTHQFEWRPEFDLVTTLAPEISDVVKAVNNLSHSSDEAVVFRGSFTYDFEPFTFGFSTSRLKTHSRVVVSSSGFRHLDSLLSLRAAGFSPLPSTAWDLTPFSFVANWFSGLGSRIRDIEANALIGAIGFRCVTHSFLVSSELADWEISKWGLSNSTLPGSESLVLKAYVREISTHLPPPRIGRFDFRMPTRLPDWLTAGSLAWQVFLSG